MHTPGGGRARLACRLRRKPQQAIEDKRVYHPTTPPRSCYPVAHDEHQAGWMHGGPLVRDDWLSLPDFVTRWWSNPTTQFPVGFIGAGRPAAFPPTPPRPQVPDVVPGPSGSAPTIPAWFPDLSAGPILGREVRTEEEMAVDWGTVLSGAVDIWQGQTVGNQPQVYSPLTSFSGANLPPANGSSKVTVDTVTGKVTRCHRRRSRPMLTPTNMGLLVQIGTLPNNANVRIALAKSIRRG